MQKNRVLEKLRQGKAALVTTVTPYASPKLTEMIGLLDFDCVWIDMEHQDYSYDQLFDMALGCRATGIVPMARIRKGDYWTYSRPFEAGATGIMVPHCRSGAEAAQIVQYARFHPLGMRGLDGVEANADYGLAPMAEYMAHTNRETFVCVQIEDCEGVEDVDAIAATAGIDILFIGPADLSQSYGIPLQTQAPIMQDAVKRVAEAAAKHGKWWGIPVGSVEVAEQYYALGARFLACGAAIIILQQGWQRIRQDFDAILQR
ncbi:MAG: HpcH/HpaI aldolase family protein [Roseiflexaceae bacterium]